MANTTLKLARNNQLVFRFDVGLWLSLLVALGVHELGDDLPGMPAGVEVVGVLADLFLGALLAAVARVDVLVVLEVVVLVLVEVLLRHFREEINSHRTSSLCIYFCFCLLSPLTALLYGKSTQALALTVTGQLSSVSFASRFSSLVVGDFYNFFL